MKLQLKNSLKYLFSDLKTRTSDSELMESQHCDTSMLLQTLHQFKYINEYLNGIRSLLQNTLIAHMHSLGKSNYTVIDLGSGGCDIPLWLSRTARQESINLIIYCIDHDKRIADYAANKCKNVKEIQIITGNVFDILSGLDADYIIANHFIHHFSDHEIVKLLKSVSVHSRCGFLINDLIRSRMSLIFFYCVATLFFRKSFSLIDGLQSITRSFRKDDFLRFKKLAKLDSVISDVSPGHICMYSLI